LDAIAVVGAIVLVGEHKSHLATVFGFIAVVAATSNIVGGFVITDRMLKMFKSVAPRPNPRRSRWPNRWADNDARTWSHPIVIELLYLVASVLFILSLKWMSSPTTARHGIWAGEIGMCWPSVARCSTTA